MPPRKRKQVEDESPTLSEDVKPHKSRIIRRSTRINSKQVQIEDDDEDVFQKQPVKRSKSTASFSKGPVLGKRERDVSSTQTKEGEENSKVLEEGKEDDGKPLLKAYPFTPISITVSKISNL